MSTIVDTLHRGTETFKFRFPPKPTEAISFRKISFYYNYFICSTTVLGVHSDYDVIRIFRYERLNVNNLGHEWIFKKKKTLTIENHWK